MLSGAGALAAPASAHAVIDRNFRWCRRCQGLWFIADGNNGPHLGARVTTWATKQGVQMRGRNDNAYLNSINTVGRPQGEGGTRWLTIGSYSDVIVSPESATNMCCSGMHKVIYEPCGIPGAAPGHTDYFGDNWGIRTAPTRGACWGTTHYDHATMSADNVGPMVERGLSGVWRDWPANAPWYC